MPFNNRQRGRAAERAHERASERERERERARAREKVVVSKQFEWRQINEREERHHYRLV